MLKKETFEVNESMTALEARALYAAERTPASLSRRAIISIMQIAFSIMLLSSVGKREEAEEAEEDGDDGDDDDDDDDEEEEEEEDDDDDDSNDKELGGSASKSSVHSSSGSPLFSFKWPKLRMSTVVILMTSLRVAVTGWKS